MNYFLVFSITIFLYVTSKSLGITLSNRLKIKRELCLPLGYLSNITLYFILTFIPMLLKSSIDIYFGFAILYLIIIIIFAIKNIKELFIFTKKEFIVIFVTLLLLLLFYFFIDFGYIDLHDSYYYSVLTNSLKSVENISVTDPRTGYQNINNYYKYLSYYYQAGFLGYISGLKLPSTVLIWSFSFMNILLLVSVAFSKLVRISKKKYVNNIISIYILSFFLSIIKVPFNFLHVTTLILPFLIVRYAVAYLKGNKNSLILYYICVLSAFAGTASTLFLTFSLIYILFIIISYRKETYTKLLWLTAPTILYGFLMIYESTKLILILFIPIFLIILFYIVFKNKAFNKMMNYCGIIASFLIPILIFITPTIFENNAFITKSFLNRDKDDSNLIVEASNCEYTEDIAIDFDFKKHGTAMNYIYSNSHSLTSTLFIMLTHSSFKYIGLIIFFIYGLVKSKKNMYWQIFIVYLITFVNPLLQEGLNLLFYGLTPRINLFFTGIISIQGIKQMFNFIDCALSKKPNQFITIIWYKLRMYLYVIQTILLFISFYAYIQLFKSTDWYNYDTLLKVPYGFAEASEVLNSYILDNKANVFYTSSAFNVSMVDDQINNKVKVLDSYEYMTYYDSKKINDKIYIDLFFENRLKEETCDIIKLLKMYEIDYIVTDEQYDENKLAELKTIYRNDKVTILTWR